MIEPLSVMFRATAPAAFFLINVVALHLFVRGHDAPGGGFIAGVCTAISLVLLSLGVTTEETRRVLKWRAARLAALGGMLAIGAASAPMFFGRAFFEHFHGDATLPLLGRVALSTTLAFDAGVYLVVLGVIVKLVFTFGLSTRGERALVAREEELFSASFEEPVERRADDRRERNYDRAR